MLLLTLAGWAALHWALFSGAPLQLVEALLDAWPAAAQVRLQGAGRQRPRSSVSWGGGHTALHTTHRLIILATFVLDFAACPTWTAVGQPRETLLASIRVLTRVFPVLIADPDLHAWCWGRRG